VTDVLPLEVGRIDGFWILPVSLGLVGALLILLARAAARARRRGISGSMLGPFDEMYRPTAYATHLEMQEQNERKKPIPSPDDL
jgi:hypothetical protein